MLELNSEQRAVLADKLPDAANIASGALVFGQFLGERPFSVWLALSGIAVWVAFVWCALVLAGKRKS